MYFRFPLFRSLLLCMAMSLTSCITEEVPTDTRHGNFEALWQTIDRHYCFFPYKEEAYGLDWNEVKDRKSVV